MLDGTRPLLGAVEMALLPILFLLTVAAATWAFRDRPARFRWTLFGGAAVITWGAVIGLLAATPSSTALSVWRPATLFRSRLEFALDDVGWTMTFVLATNLLVSSAFMASGSRAPREVPATFTLGLAAVAMAGVMAGNFASLLVCWALFDLILLVRRLSSAGELGEQSGGGLAIFADLLSLMMILIATATLKDPAASGTISAPPLGIALLAAAAFLRLRGGLQASGQRAEGPGDDLSDGFARVVSAGMGTTLLVRIVAGGVPPAMMEAAQACTCLLAAFSSARWIARWRAAGSERGFLTALASYGALASIPSASGAERSALAAAALALCAVQLLTHRQIHLGMHRVPAVAMALMVCALPGTLGGTLLGGLVSSRSGPLDLALAAVAVLGLGLLAGGILRQVGQPTEPWPTGEALPKGLFTIGKFVPLLAAAGLSLRLASLPTAAGWGAFVLATSVAWVTGTMPLRSAPWAADRWRRLSVSIDSSGARTIARGVIGAGMRVFYGLSSLLEGEGAMLWVLVLLMVIVLGWSSG